MIYSHKSSCIFKEADFYSMNILFVIKSRQFCPFGMEFDMLNLPGERVSSGQLVGKQQQKRVAELLQQYALNAYCLAVIFLPCSKVTYPFASLIMSRIQGYCRGLPLLDSLKLIIQICHHSIFGLDPGISFGVRWNKCEVSI